MHLEQLTEECKIMYPMITNINEIREAIIYFRGSERRIKARGQNF